ncbi:MAG TPA: hypothetical protein VFA12_20135 [Stellaceae bacterium]|nr:hypothetical protein [Stellaceae bacterium]
MRYLVLIVIILIFIFPTSREATLAVIAGLMHQARDLGQSGLPECDSPRAREEVDDTISRAPLGKIYGISVIEYDAVETVSQSASLVECKATVVLNNDTSHPATYSFTLKGDQQFVRFRIIGLGD